ncbi:MAG TPA: PQQ-binding-like beta-propeller repeat protein [Vicinamibacterales bacterium]|jgi:outer membrane protein assembly factor BamB
MTTLRLSLLVSAALLTGSEAATDTTSWPQWGGPARNFVVDARPLATTWPAGGPRKRWRKAIGDGFSSIVTDGRAVYTLYRDGTNDVAIALDAATGDVLWQTRYEAPFVETCSERLGPVPRAAPLLASSRVVTVSAGGLMNSFNRATGQRLWSVDLHAGDAQAVRACGYASSPLAFEDLVITTAGGTGRGVIAIKSATGEIAWKSQDFQNAYSSPLLIDLDGQPEVVVFTYGEVSGLNPRTGALEWTHPHAADQGVNVATPVWGKDNLLFVSSAYNGGSRVLKLARSNGRVSVQEVWANRRVRIHFGNAVRIGDNLYASNGDFGAAPFAAIDVKTGDIVWRDRSVARSTLIAAGDKLLILDEDGTLALATPTGTGLTVLAKAAVLDGRSWTVPALSGSTLYARNGKEIVALDLSPSAMP